MADHTWKRLESRVIYENDQGMSVCEDLVELPNGKRSAFVVFVSRDGVGVLPLDEREQVVLVRQYRYAEGEWSWEIPLGTIGPDEQPEQAARRELAEEAHLRADELAPLGVYHTNQSILRETVHVFLARDLDPADGRRDADELIETRRFPFDRVLRMVLDGEIRDGTTIIATLLAARRLGK